MEIPTNKNQHVKFEANVKQLLLIKISMAFGSTATIQVSKMQIRSFTKNQSLCRTQLNDMYINIVSWNLGFSEIQVHYIYKQKDLVYNGHVLPCSYKNENCQPTAHFPSWTFLFQIELCFVSFSHQLEAKTTKSKNRFRIESLPVGQNTENMPACHSLFNKNPGYRNTSFEVLPEINFFCNQQSLYHKTQNEDIPVRNQGGFNTHTGLPERRNVFETPINWRKNEVSKSRPRFVTLDVRSKK